ALASSLANSIPSPEAHFAKNASCLWLEDIFSQPSVMSSSPSSHSRGSQHATSAHPSFTDVDSRHCVGYPGVRSYVLASLFVHLAATDDHLHLVAYAHLIKPIRHLLH